MGQDFNDLDELPGDSELGRTHQLAWALLDEHISPDEQKELENLLSSDPTARESYVRCAQLHADLAMFFAPPKLTTSQPAAKSPVLGFLAENFPPLGTTTTGDAAK
jgi:hypothetical protein